MTIYIDAEGTPFIERAAWQDAITYYANRAFDRAFRREVNTNRV